MSTDIVEVSLKCRVPAEEADEHITRLRRGDERLPVPAGMICRDAFDCHEATDAYATVIRVVYR